MKKHYTRRAIIKSTGIVLPAALLSFPALAATGKPRRLAFYHTHTSEKLDVVYHDGADYVADALTELDTLLRDFRTGDVYPIERNLLDLLHSVHQLTGSNAPFQIISGYRSPATNQNLRNQGRGVARRSLHMQGKAIDVRLADVSTKNLREASLSLQAGGVGYYPGSAFVHLDTGRVRFW